MISIGVNTLYFLALINPISKIAMLSVLARPEERQDLQDVVRKSTFVASLILLGSMFFGDMLLRRVFHVEMHSLRLSGGLVLFWIGFNALRKGVFVERESTARFSDLAIVPLACPMIAGPATIAASINLTAEQGILPAAAAVLAAVLINSVFMCFSKTISHVLIRFNIMGALIRIIGLIVMTVGVQMALDGLSHWINSI